MTKQLFLIGYPVKNTAGKALTQVACDYLNLDVRFDEWEIQAHSELNKAFSYFKRPEVIGVMVTMPHKEGVMVFMDELDDEAQTIGAINRMNK